MSDIQQSAATIPAGQVQQSPPLWPPDTQAFLIGHALYGAAGALALALLLKLLSYRRPSLHPYAVYFMQMYTVYAISLVFLMPQYIAVIIPAALAGMIIVRSWSPPRLEPEPEVITDHLKIITI